MESVADLCVTQTAGAGALGRYWIRNRGRVQGPFTVDRIQGLLRRGRFSRHFHVSEDKEEWYPASEFPEFFVGSGGRGGSGSDDDDEVFRGGGSPFGDDDDEDLAPTRPSRGGRRRRPADDDDEDLDDEDDDEIDEDDDDDWDDDDDSGVLSGLLDWVEDHAKVLAGVLVILLLGLGWFVFGRESFAQDAADLEVLLAVKTKISTAHSMGADATAWQRLTDTTLEELKPMVDRLNETASARDHVKQELLFSARDHIPKMLNELPRGQTEAEKRVMLSFSRIDQMIREEVRISQESVLGIPAAAPATPPQPGGATEQQQPKSEPEPSAEAAESPPAPSQGNPAASGQQQQQQQQGMPQGNNASPIPEKNLRPPVQPQNNNGGVPGRPNPAKF